jgi:hypothetical protein
MFAAKAHFLRSTARFDVLLAKTAHLRQGRCAHSEDACEGANCLTPIMNVAPQRPLLWLKNSNVEDTEGSNIESTLLTCLSPQAALLAIHVRLAIDCDGHVQASPPSKPRLRSAAVNVECAVDEDSEWHWPDTADGRRVRG